MKQCRFCDHFGRTKNGEDVCYKHLIFLDDDPEPPCDGPEISITQKKSLWVIVVVLVIALIISLA